MNRETDEQVQNPRQHAAILYSSLQQLAGRVPEAQQQVLLNQALEEVMTTLEEMEAIDENLLRKNRALAEAQAEARVERNRYRELFEAVSEGLIITSADGEIRELNSCAAKLLQVRPSQGEGQRMFDFLSELEAQQVRSCLESLSESNRVVRCAVRIQPRRGEVFPADLTLTWLQPEFDAAPQFRWMVREVSANGTLDSVFQQACDELKAAHASAQDVSLRRLAELEEANRRLEQQIAERRRIEDEIVSRSRELERRLEKRTAQYQDAARAQDSIARFLGDLCANPLRALDSQARVLQERWGHSLPPEARKQVTAVLNKTRGLHELLESIATYARVAKQPLERQRIDTAALVAEVLQSLEAAQDGRCIEVRVGDLLECSADREMLRLVLTHLLSNALKFTRSREATIIEIQCRKAGNEVIWSIRDNGIGFRKDQLHRLFQPFQRLHRTQGYDGAGVGLATAGRIISRHDGRIWAEPNLNGAGATFYFTLSPAS